LREARHAPQPDKTGTDAAQVTLRRAVAALPLLERVTLGEALNATIVALWLLLAAFWCGYAFGRAFP
jgi:hypothetical protein